MNVNRGHKGQKKSKGPEANETISDEHIREEMLSAMDRFGLEKKRILVLIPDGTRSAPIDRFFRLFHQQYSQRTACVDYLIALGTHPLMSEAQKLRRVGIDNRQKEGEYRDVKIMNHRWDEPDIFTSIGTISRSEVSELSEGLLDEEVEITVNKRIFEYDVLIVLGPVFPHEVVGFSGSNKYLFPGICGWKFTDLTHWLGALRTNIKTIGVADTPQRRLIDRAAELVSIPIVYFNLVVDQEGLKGLFVGDDDAAWREAVRLSARLNVRYVEKPFHTVLSIPSEMYDDLWTGAKAFYKIEPIVEDGGSLIIYAPHIGRISITHDKVIQKVGFHVMEYFRERMRSYERFPRMVLAYSALVTGAGTYRSGVEKPRIHTVLATGIPGELCERLNIGWKDPGEINVDEMERSENEGVKVIHDAGEVLYKVAEK
jgi:nickel-dependent lactate racemase